MEGSRVGGGGWAAGSELNPSLGLFEIATAWDIIPFQKFETQ